MCVCCGSDLGALEVAEAAETAREWFAPAAIAATVTPLRASTSVGLAALRTALPSPS